MPGRLHVGLCPAFWFLNFTFPVKHVRGPLVVLSPHVNPNHDYRHQRVLDPSLSSGLLRARRPVAGRNPRRHCRRNLPCRLRRLRCLDLAGRDRRVATASSRDVLPSHSCRRVHLHASLRSCSIPNSCYIVQLALHSRAYVAGSHLASTALDPMRLRPASSEFLDGASFAPR